LFHAIDWNTSATAFPLGIGNAPVTWDPRFVSGDRRDDSADGKNISKKALPF
jgi:hypothetical protein